MCKNDSLNVNNLEHDEVFSSSLGCYKNEIFELAVISDSKPLICRPRGIPFSLKDKVILELNRLIAESLIEPVESSEWATPIVPVVVGVLNYVEITKLQLIQIC